jgi:RNA polymerase sigma-70 factor (ECF subfamily)
MADPAEPSSSEIRIKMHGTIAQSQLTATGSKPSDVRTDEELLLGYRSRGDRRAFTQLVHRYEKELFGYLRHYLGDAEQAEDVFQQTFLQVHLKCRQFEAGRKVRPWLYTIATNQAIDLQRRNRRHRMASLDRCHGKELDDEAGTLLQLVDSPELGPAEQTELAETRQQVRRAVEDLPEPARQVVILVYFQGLKYREAAEVLSVPVGTVKSRLHTAIHKLSETLTCSRLPK